jgi:DNA-directed RNA polymerase specialized sigma24 family protein
MVEDSSRGNGRWTLSRGAFDRLLAQLDEDRDRAGERYEVLRRKLIVFFAASDCTTPETHADEALTRIARRIDEGEQIRDVFSYALGVARLLLREVRKNQRRERDVTDAAARTAGTAEETARLECLDRCVEGCLGELSAESRRLVLAYYAGDRSAKIDGRRRLAAELGISVSALRLRLHRVRARLARCVRARLDDEDADARRGLLTVGER